MTVSISPLSGNDKRNGHAKSRKNFSTEDYCIVGTYEKGTLKTDVAASACPSNRCLLPFPLRPRNQRPDPPLAEVQVAEEERLLQPARSRGIVVTTQPGQLLPKFLVRSSMADRSIIQRVRNVTPGESSDQTLDDGHKSPATLPSSSCYDNACTAPVDS